MNRQGQPAGRQGFSLIEVTIFVAIMSIFFVMAVGMSTSTLATLKTSERRTYATRYAEEAVEWLQGEKDNDWDNTFLPKAPSGTPTIYCFNSTMTTWPTSGACPSFTLGGFFKREVSMSRQANTTPGDYQVTAVVTVSWQQGTAGTMSVPVSIIFNKFE